MWRQSRLQSRGFVTGVFLERCPSPLNKPWTPKLWRRRHQLPVMAESGTSVWFFEPVLNLFGRQISPAGITTFVVCLVAGLVFFSFLQSGFMRRQLSRLGLDKGLVAILTASIGLVAFLAFVVLGLNLGGLAIAWD